MKKLILLIFSILILSSFVSAIPTGAITYYNFSSVTDLWGSNDATNTGATSVTQYPTFNISGDSSPNSFNFGDDGDFVSNGDDIYDSNSSGSISLWFNTNTAGATHDGIFYAGTSDGTEDYIALIHRSNNNSLTFFSRYDAGTVWVYDSEAVARNTWNHLVITHASGSTDYNLYINGELNTLSLRLGAVQDFWFDDFQALTTNYQVGRFSSGVTQHYYNGEIDVFKYFDRALNATEVANLYNYNQIDYTPPVTNYSYHRVKVISNYTGGVLEDINVTLSNGTNIISNLTQSDGIAYFSNLTGNYTYTTGNGTDYFINTGISTENTTVITSLKETNITLRFIFSSGDLVNFTNINLTDLDYGNYNNISTGTINIFPPAENINFSAKDFGNVFYNTTFNFSLTSLQNDSFNITLSEKFNSFTFLDANDSSAIDNATLYITYPNGNTTSIQTNSSGVANFSFIFNNSLQFGEYDFVLSKIGYINLSFSETINESNVPLIKTYNVSRAKLNIYIYDRVTRALLTGVNVTVAFIGLFNETTTTGSVIKDNLSILGGDYLVYASTDDYKTSVRSLTFTNQEEFTLNFYLLNLSDATAGTLFVTTFDSYFRLITGAKVELLEYIPTSLSYVSVDECVSNVDAQCSFAIELNTKVYYIRATKIIDGELLVAETDQNGEIFTVNNDNRDLVFYTRDDFEIEPSSDLVFNISESFVGNTSSISVDFFSISGTALTVCIEYFRDSGSGYVSVSSNCLTSSSAVQNIDVNMILNRSNDYRAEVYIDNGASNILLGEYVYPSIRSFGEVFDKYIVKGLILLFWIIALSFSLHSKNIVFFFILSIVLSWLQLIFFPLESLVSIAVFKTIISIFTFMVARKKRDLQ